MRIINLFSWVLLILTNVFFVFLVADFSLNIPYYDDFDAIGSFILQYRGSGFWNLFSRVLDQYAEHRIGYTRLVSLLYFQITGQINFQHLIFWGISGLVGIQLLIYFKIKKSKHGGLILLIVGIMLLNFQYWENMMSAMTSLQNLSAPFFCLGALFFLTLNSDRENRILSYLFVFSAVFTSGNGIILLPIGLVYLIILNVDKSKLIEWIFLMCCVLWVYFSDYHTPPEVFGGRSNIWDSITNPIAFFQNFTLFLTFCFNGIGLAYHWCFLLGGIILVYMCYYIYFVFFVEGNSKTRWYASVLVFLLGTSFLVALNRSESIENMLFSRYKIYSTLLMIFLFLSCYEMFPLRRVLFVFLLCSSYFSYHSLPFVSTLYNHFNELRYASYSYQLNSKNWVGIYPPYTTYFTNAKNASMVCQNLEKFGYYNPPALLKSAEINWLNQPTFSKGCSTYRFNDFGFHALLLFDSSTTQVDQFNCIEMKSSKKIVLVPLKFNFSPKDLLKMLWGRNVIVNAFSAIIPKSNIDHGQYKLTLIKTNEYGQIEKCKITDREIPYLANPQFHN